MPYFPPCYASLSLLPDTHGTITLQRCFVFTLVDLYLLVTLLPSIVTYRSTGCLTLVLSAFATVSVVSITTSTQQPLLGYSVAHAVVAAALFVCSLLSHSYQQCRSVPLGSTGSPGSSLWSSGAWVCLAGFLAHSAIVRIVGGSCGEEDKLPWLDLCVGLFLVSTGALVFTGNLFQGEAMTASAERSSSSGAGKEVEESEAPLLTQSDRAGEKEEEDDEEERDPTSPLPSTSAPGHPPIPPPSLHDAASTFSVWTFSWLDALFVTGLKRQLDLWDLEGLPLEDATVQASARFQAVLFKVGGKRRRVPLSASASTSTSTRGSKKLYTLVWALLKCYGWPWAVVGAFQVGCVAAALVAPLALQGLLEYLSSPTSPSPSTSSNPTPLQGLAWVCALACIQVASALCTTQLNYRVSRLQLVVRGGLVGALQRRVLGAPLGVRKGTPPGRLTNLLTVDIDRVLNLVPSFHQAWTLPLQVGAVIGELAGNVSWGCLGGVGVLGVLVPANLAIAGRLGVLTGVMMGARDARVAGVGEVLGGIRAVKAGGWEGALLGRIGEARGREFAALTARKYLDAACVWCWACTPLLMALATFSLVLALPGGTQGGGGDFFSPSKIWASLAMLNLLVFPLNAFPWVISGMLEARVSLQRLSEFLVEEEEEEEVEEGEGEEGIYTALGQNGKEEEEEEEEGQKHLPPKHHSTLNVVLEDVLPPGVLVNARGSFMHAPSSEREEEGGGGGEEKDKGEDKKDKGITGEGVHTGHTQTTTPFCLQLGEVGVSVSRAEIVGVCGVMAAGKSSFLLALLGELSTALPDAPGGVAATTTMSPTCTLSYAPQSPWIRDGTLVDNVVFGESIHREQEGGGGVWVVGVAAVAAMAATAAVGAAGWGVCGWTQAV
jgi:ABC-type multidrug transport system fused ATPase/permease subunit